MRLDFFFILLEFRFVAKDARRENPDNYKESTVSTKFVILNVRTQIRLPLKATALKHQQGHD